MEFRDPNVGFAVMLARGGAAAADTGRSRSRPSKEINK